MMVSLKTLLEKLGKDATAGDYVKDFKKSGGRFIIPLPKIQII